MHAYTIRGEALWEKDGFDSNVLRGREGGRGRDRRRGREVRGRGEGGKEGEGEREGGGRGGEGEREGEGEGGEREREIGISNEGVCASVCPQYLWNVPLIQLWPRCVCVSVSGGA